MPAEHMPVPESGDLEPYLPSYGERTAALERTEHQRLSSHLSRLDKIGSCRRRRRNASIALPGSISTQPYVFRPDAESERNRKPRNWLGERANKVLSTTSYPAPQPHTPGRLLFAAAAQVNKLVSTTAHPPWGRVEGPPPQLRVATLQLQVERRATDWRQKGDQQTTRRTMVVGLAHW